MTHCEVDSFLTKFKQLWHAGIKATLIVKSTEVGATVELTAGLGAVPRPHHVPGYHSQPSRQHRGASYYRRQERRQEARHQAEMHAADQVSQTNIAEKAAEGSEDVAFEDDLNSGAEIESARIKISSLIAQLNEADQKSNEKVRLCNITIEELNDKIKEASKENQELRNSISAKTTFHELFRDEMKDKFGYDSDEEAERNWQEHLEREKLDQNKFSCGQCVFNSKTEAGLKIHENKKHRIK